MYDVAASLRPAAVAAGCFFSAPSPLGNGRFSIDGAVSSSISCWAYSRSGSTVACGFLRCRVSLWRTSLGPRVVRKDSGFRLHSRKKGRHFSLHCDEVQLIGNRGWSGLRKSPNCKLVSIHLPLRTLDHEPLWLSCWTMCAEGMCEVDSDCTHEKVVSSD